MKDRLRRFMYGRYGSDGLNRFLSVLSLALFLLALFLRLGLLYWLGIGCLVLTYLRMFSRDIAKRSAENAAYYSLKGRLEVSWQQKRVRFAQRGLYRYYRCPHCRQQLRVPRGRGKILITCPKCHTEFTKKS